MILKPNWLSSENSQSCFTNLLHAVELVLTLITIAICIAQCYDVIIAQCYDDIIAQCYDVIIVHRLNIV